MVLWVKQRAGPASGKEGETAVHVTQPRWVASRKTASWLLLWKPRSSGAQDETSSQSHWAKAFHSKSGAKRSTLSPSLPHSPPPFHQPHPLYTLGKPTPAFTPTTQHTASYTTRGPQVEWFQLLCCSSSCVHASLSLMNSFKNSCWQLISAIPRYPLSHSQ